MAAGAGSVRDGFDLRAALDDARRQAAPVEIDVDAVLRGTRNVERVEIGSVAVLVRATSISESAAAVEAARLVVELEATPGQLYQVAVRHQLARAVLDPDAVRAGRRAPLFDVHGLGRLPRWVLDDLTNAMIAAIDRAYPDVDERAARALNRQIQDRAVNAHLHRIRARGCGPAELFDVTELELTHWQHAYFNALRGT